MNLVRGPTEPFPERADAGEVDIHDPEEQRQALAELAEVIAARRLTPIALFVLESMRPLSFVTAEFMVFLEPFVRIFLPPRKYRLLAEAMHDRANVAWLIERLEQLAEGRTAADPSQRLANGDQRLTEDHSGGEDGSAEQTRRHSGY